MKVTVNDTTYRCAEISYALASKLLEDAKLKHLELRRDSEASLYYNKKLDTLFIQTNDYIAIHHYIVDINS